MRPQTTVLALLLLCVSVATTRADEPKTENSATPPAPEVRSPEMITIPTTTCKMGSPIGDDGSRAHRPEETPQHDITVDAFAIGRFVVTAEEFCRFLNAEGNHDYFRETFIGYDYRTIKKEGDRFVPQQGAERCPAYPVTWNGADAYCKWLAMRLNKPYRLPTEAEWELTARGKELREWPWGDEPPTVVVGEPVEPATPTHIKESVEQIAPLLDALFGAADLVDKVIPDRTPKEGEIVSIQRANPNRQRVPYYLASGERFCGNPTDFSRPWLGPPVGSFPMNATPDSVYDMVGYYHPQWCADVFDEQTYARSKDSASKVRPDTDSARSRRGMWQVPIRERFFEKQDNPIATAITKPFLGDAPLMGYAHPGPDLVTGRRPSHQRRRHVPRRVVCPKNRRHAQVAHPLSRPPPNPITPPPRLHLRRSIWVLVHPSIRPAPRTASSVATCRHSEFPGLSLSKAPFRMEFTRRGGHTPFALAPSPSPPTTYGR